MGFLRFLKRGKKDDALDEMDLPPTPPPLEGFDENLPELPDFPAFGDKDTIGREEFATIDFPEKDEMAQDSGREGSFADIPAYPETEKNQVMPAPPISPPKIVEPAAIAFPPLSQQAAQEEAIQPPQDVYPKIERKLFSHEKRALTETPSGKALYIRVDRFKATLGSISTVRGDLRKSEEALMKLESIKITKDKSFDKVKFLLDDLQRKLIFVDKTLFKGE